MSEDGPKLVSIPVKVAPMLRYRLQVAAEKAGVTQCELIRRAIAAYLRDEVGRTETPDRSSGA